MEDDRMQRGHAMKFALFGSIMLSFISAQSFAASDEDLAAVCYTTGVGKVMIRAEQMDCRVRVRDIQVVQVDNAWYKPTKVIEYSAVGECGQNVTEKVEYTKHGCK
jgi:hypothetical protein